MRQLPLELSAEKPQTLETFVAGTNDELMQHLQTLAQFGIASRSEHFIYLWGAPSAGKTHLLQAMASSPVARSVASSVARYIAADAGGDTFAYSPDQHIYLLDDCDRLSDEAQILAFALFNQVRENNGIMITAGAVAPAILGVREDLRTRLGCGLIYQVHELTDDEKIAALSHSASARGLTLSSGVLPYLMTHFKRDMRSLSAMLDALDHYSLETKRPITLPLLRDLLLQEPEINEP
jgi:DnaA family protein